MAHAPFKIINLPGDALQVLAMQSFVRSHGPAVTLTLVLPSGQPFEIIKDFGEEPTEVAWPAVHKLFESLTPLTVGIAFMAQLQDYVAAANPDDVARDLKAIGLTVAAVERGMKGFEGSE